MFWIALAFAAYSLLVTGLYDEVRSQLDDTQDLQAANAALRAMIGNGDRDLYAAWRDECNAHADTVAALQGEVARRVEAERAYSRLAALSAGHPSAIGLDPGLVDAIRATGRDDCKPHGIERPALKIVEGL